MVLPTTAHTQPPLTERTLGEILLDEKPKNEGGAVLPWTVKRLRTVEFLSQLGIVIEEVIIQIAELADICKRDRFAAALEFSPLAECNHNSL